MENRITLIQSYIINENWDKAFALAIKTRLLGKNKTIIERAHGCISNPRFFSQICNTEKCIYEGKKALRFIFKDL